VVLVRAIAIWLPIAAATTGLTGVVYGVTQQSLRLGADDAGVALALRTTARLDAGESATAAVPADQVELTTSLDPFALVFDSNGRQLASSAALHGQLPTYPPGVFNTLRVQGEDRVTWQPEPGVRSATVAVAWHGGYVVAGRSLRLTEQHIDQVGQIVVVGWLATLMAIAAAALVAVLLHPPDDGLTLSLGPWRILRVAAPVVS